MISVGRLARAEFFPVTELREFDGRESVSVAVEFSERVQEVAPKAATIRNAKEQK